MAALYARSATFLLVGSKLDLPRQVSTPDAETFAAEKGLIYFEVSCQPGALQHTDGLLEALVLAATSPPLDANPPALPPRDMPPREDDEANVPLTTETVGVGSENVITTSLLQPTEEVDEEEDLDGLDMDIYDVDPFHMDSQQHQLEEMERRLVAAKEATELAGDTFSGQKMQREVMLHGEPPMTSENTAAFGEIKDAIGGA